MGLSIIFLRAQSFLGLSKRTNLLSLILTSAWRLNIKRQHKSGEHGFETTMDSFAGDSVDNDYHSDDTVELRVSSGLPAFAI